MPIPASQLVSVQPGVIGAGGSAQSLNGLVLTTSTRIPTGAAMSFSTAADVGRYFGGGSIEQQIATQYFTGYIGRTVTPGTLWFAQYPWASAVAPYLRGGVVSTYSTTHLQGISGTLIVTIDGTTFTSSSFNLGTATGFSSAAAIIQTALGAVEVTATGALAPAVGVTAATSTIAGTTLTIATVSSGVIVADSGGNSILTGSGVAAGTAVLSQLTGTAGGAGTYQVSIAQTVAATAMTVTNAGVGVMTLSAASGGTVAVGQNVVGAGVNANQQVIGFIGGSGGTGTYLVSNSQTVSSESLQLGVATVTYDAISGAFVITGGQTGSTASMSFATGTTATALKLTSAQGATISQGADVATPGAFMDSLVQRLTNFFSFFTAFTPGINTQTGLAAWTAAQNDSWLYILPDQDSTLITSSYAASAWGVIQATQGDGTLPIYVAPNSTTDPAIYAAAVSGFFAALDFNQLGGRQTLAYRRSPNLALQISRGDWAQQLIANGVNFYGNYAFANSAFTWWQPGSISGQFLWADTYAQAVFLKTQIQSAMLTLLENVGNIPYNAKGNALIAAACLGPITKMINYGAIQPGVTLSPLQIAEVNNLVGVPIDATLFAVGWYLQVGTATAQVRAARASPPITLLYVDGQSVQQISIASIVVE